MNTMYFPAVCVCRYYSCLNVITMQVGVTLKARWGHSLTAFSLGPGLTELVEFGGSPEPVTRFEKTQSKMAHTILLQFSECAHNYIHHVFTQIIISEQKRANLIVQRERFFSLILHLDSFWFQLTLEPTWALF